MGHRGTSAGIFLPWTDLKISVKKKKSESSHLPFKDSVKVWEHTRVPPLTPAVQSRGARTAGPGPYHRLEAGDQMRGSLRASVRGASVPVRGDYDPVAAAAPQLVVGVELMDVASGA